MAIVISRLSAPVEYTLYSTAEGRSQKVGVVRVEGGAGVADRKTLQTPQGVPTTITAEEAAALKENSVFKEHVAAGVVELVEKGKVDAEKAAQNMAADASAPLTPASYAARGKKAPATSKG